MDGKFYGIAYGMKLMCTTCYVIALPLPQQSKLISPHTVGSTIMLYAKCDGTSALNIII